MSSSAWSMNLGPGWSCQLDSPSAITCPFDGLHRQRTSRTQSWDIDRRTGPAAGGGDRNASATQFRPIWSWHRATTQEIASRSAAVIAEDVGFREGIGADRGRGSTWPVITTNRTNPIWGGGAWPSWTRMVAPGAFESEKHTPNGPVGAGVGIRQHGCHACSCAQDVLERLGVRPDAGAFVNMGRWRRTGSQKCV